MRFPLYFNYVMNKSFINYLCVSVYVFLRARVRFRHTCIKRKKVNQLNKNNEVLESGATTVDLVVLFKKPMSNLTEIVCINWQ